VRLITVEWVEVLYPPKNPNTREFLFQFPVI